MLISLICLKSLVLMKTLFADYHLSGLLQNNRIVMAPMTRSRAADTVPNDETALYYAQRSGAGLIVTEGSQVSRQGVGYLFTPGIHTEEQAAGWRKVTHAVHEQGGKIFSQLWHVGRISHTSSHENGVPPVGPTSKTAENTTSFVFHRSIVFSTCLLSNARKRRGSRLHINSPKRSLADVHISNRDTLIANEEGKMFLRRFREAYAGTLILAGLYTKEAAQQDVRDGLTDLVAFGRPFISNPDLVERLKNDWPMTTPDPSTFYGGDHVGYTDYPVYETSAV